jgi:hypothetical protein
MFRMKFAHLNKDGKPIARVNHLRSKFITVVTATTPVATAFRMGDTLPAM